MSKAIFLKPRMSEKAYALSEQQRTYVFDVPATINKQGVAKAVAAQYDVVVASVGIAKTASKSRRTVRRGGRGTVRGRSAGVRKAYVQLAEGQTLPIFAATKEQEEKETKAAAKEAKRGTPAKEAPKKIAKVDKTEEKPAIEKKSKRGLFGFRTKDRTSIRGNK